jgi:hypothetical protein
MYTPPSALFHAGEEPLKGGRSSAAFLSPDGL